MDPGPDAGAGRQAGAIGHRLLRGGHDRQAFDGKRLPRSLFCPSHPEQGFRTCLGVLALAKSYDATRLDAACRRGLTIQTRSVASIRSILKNGLDRAFLEDRPDDRPLHHANIRGQGYYH